VHGARQHAPYGSATGHVRTVGASKDVELLTVEVDERRG